MNLCSSSLQHTCNVAVISFNTASEATYNKSILQITKHIRDSLIRVCLCYWNCSRTSWDDYSGGGLSPFVHRLQRGSPGAPDRSLRTVGSMLTGRLRSPVSGTYALFHQLFGTRKRWSQKPKGVSWASAQRTNGTEENGTVSPVMCLNAPKKVAETTIYFYFLIIPCFLSERKQQMLTWRTSA